MARSRTCITNIRNDFHSWLQTFITANAVIVPKNQESLSPDDKSLILRTLSHSRTVDNWLNGKHKATKRLVDTISGDLPEVSVHYNQPMFSLLDPKKPSPKKLFKCLENLLKQPPEIKDGLYSKLTFKPFSLTKELFLNNQHLYEFTKELLFLRLSEIHKLKPEHPYILQKIYHRLPYVAAMDSFYPFRTLLFKSVILLHQNSKFSQCVIKANWRTIAKKTKTLREKPSPYNSTYYLLGAITDNTSTYHGVKRKSRLKLSIDNF